MKGNVDVLSLCPTGTEIIQPQNFGCVLSAKLNTMNDMNSRLMYVYFYFFICLPEFYFKKLLHSCGNACPTLCCTSETILF